MGEPSRALRVGIQLPEVERVVRWPEMRAMARLAEDAGFDSLWVGDHLLYRDQARGVRGPWEAWTTLAGLAEATSRIALGPLVAATSFRAPAMLAKMAATVDEISGGRLVLGLGAGWNEVEFQAFGFPFDHRISRFEEAFSIVRRLLREGVCDFAGSYYSVRDCELLPRPRKGGPPLLIGSSGERMLRIALPHVDAWNVWYDDIDNSPARLPRYRERVDRVCRDVGRDPITVERTAAVLVRLRGGVGRDDAGSRRGIRPLAGSAEEIAAGLLGFAREGIGHVQLVLDPITEASIAELAPVLGYLDAEVLASEAVRTVIFACVHNAGRSQMAAATFNALADPALARALSAGTRPAARVHPEVVEAMREVGIDLSGASPQRLTRELAAGAQLLITMGCGDECPVVPGLACGDWALEDPKDRSPARVREIRDEIRARVSQLIAREGWTRRSRREDA